MKNNEQHVLWKIQEYTQKLLSTLRASLVVALLMPTWWTIKSENSDIFQSKEQLQRYESISTTKEETDVIKSYEGVFKDGIRKALKSVNTISQIPTGGKHIEYYRDEGQLKGKKIKPENLQTLKLPEKFDFSPRNITKPVVSMTFHLGNRKFTISPVVGKIKDFYLTPESLVIETNFLVDITYNKEEKLPDLMLRLWKTPVGKGEKKWFKWSIVTEI